MTIAELFVKIGITGSDDTKKELKSVSDKISDISSSSLAAKAAILGVLYGLQRLTSDAGKAGMSLIQFSTLTGMNIEQLQKYEYAMIQGGGTALDFRNSISTLQDTMSNMINLGEGAPKGFGLFEKAVGFDRAKSNDMFYVIDKLQEFSKTQRPEVAKAMMKSFGITDTVISSMMQGVFNKKNFDAAPIYSMKEAMSLKGIDRAWANVGNDMEHGMGKIIQKFGPGFINDMGKLVKEVFKLAAAFAQLAKDTDFLSNLGKAIGKVADGINLLTTMTNLFGGIFGDKEMAKSGDRQLKAFNKENGGEEKSFDLKEMNRIANEAYRNSHPEKFIKETSKFVGPPAPAKTDIKVEQTLNFQHEGKEHKKTGDSVKKAVEGAFLQLPSQTQVV